MSSLPMENGALRHHIADMRQSFLDEGFLDRQFIQLEVLQDKDNPHFVEEVFTLFFADTTKLLETVEIILEQFPHDCPQVNRLLHQLKGSNASIGAIKITNKSGETRHLFVVENLEGVNFVRTKASLQELKREHEVLRVKVETYFQLMTHADPEETAMLSEETTTPPSEEGNSLANGA